MSEELKPCAHCGREPRIFEREYYGEHSHLGKKYSILCIFRPTEGALGFDDVDEAIKAWNRRAGDE